MTHNNGMLTREILGALSESDMERREVATSRGRAFVREMNGVERLSFQAENARLRRERGDDGWFDDYRARLLARTLCDESGKALLDPGQHDCVTRLPGVDFDALAEAADDLNFPRAETLMGKSQGTPSS